MSHSSCSWIIWKDGGKRDGRLEQWGKKRGGRSPAGDVDDEKEKCLFELRMEGLLQQRRER